MGDSKPAKKTAKRVGVVVRPESVVDVAFVDGDSLRICKHESVLLDAERARELLRAHPYLMATEDS